MGSGKNNDLRRDEENSFSASDLELNVSLNVQNASIKLDSIQAKKHLFII